MERGFGYPHPVNSGTSAHSSCGNGRLGMFSLTRNGPELDAETSELGPNRITGGFSLDQSTFARRKTALGGAA